MSAGRIDDGGPAFPAPDLGEQDFAQRGAYPGMSLRDHFAGQAMQGLLARKFTADESGRPFVEWATELAFEVADAMLRARKVGT